MRCSSWIALGCLLAQGCLPYLLDPAPLRQPPGWSADQTSEDKDAERASNRAADTKRARDLAAIDTTGERLDRAPAHTHARTCLGPTSAATDVVAEALDASMIESAMTAVKPAARECRAGHAVVRISVAPAGCVTDVIVDSSSSPALTDCIATALHGARFPATTTGGTFRYPL